MKRFARRRNAEAARGIVLTVLLLTSLCVSWVAGRDQGQAAPVAGRGARDVRARAGLPDRAGRRGAVDQGPGRDRVRRTGPHVRRRESRVSRPAGRRRAARSPGCHRAARRQQRRRALRQADRLRRQSLVAQRHHALGWRRLRQQRSRSVVSQGHDRRRRRGRTAGDPDRIRRRPDGTDPVQPPDTRDRQLGVSDGRTDRR